MPWRQTDETTATGPSGKVLGHSQRKTRGIKEHAVPGAAMHFGRQLKQRINGAEGAEQLAMDEYANDGACGKAGVLCVSPLPVFVLFAVLYVCTIPYIQYHDQRTPYSRVVAGHTPPRSKVVTLVSSETGDVLPNPSLSPEPVNLATRLIGCMELSINLKSLKKETFDCGCSFVVSLQLLRNHECASLELLVQE